MHADWMRCHFSRMIHLPRGTTEYQEAFVQLFPKEKTIGIFRGFTEGGLEFHADLALPYQSNFQNIPMHGQLVLVQLETPDEAVLGRITSLSSDGRLTGTAGEDFNIRAMRESRNVRSEEHTSELQSPCNLVCRLLLEKKK